MKKKVIFLNRDGTLIQKPKDTQQINTIEQLEFMPKVIRTLYNIRKNLDYELVMIHNQEKLNTLLNSAKIVQEKILSILKGEDIEFDAIFIDQPIPNENKSTLMSETAFLLKYPNHVYNLKESYVIGNTISDIEIAKNLGCKCILYGNKEIQEELSKINLESYCELISKDWEEIYERLALPQRIVSIRRKTRETDVAIKINLDGNGISDINTGLKFFDHMLSQISSHGNIDLTIEVTGDLEVDEHHTIEDTALALGEAIAKSITTKIGMQRYGFCLPMDDCLAQVTIDFGGRPHLVWNVKFNREKIGDVPTEMFYHFFKSFSDTARCNINIKAEGVNEHHKIESIFKAFARSLRMALRRDPFNPTIPSTKGII